MRFDFRTSTNVCRYILSFFLTTWFGTPAANSASHYERIKSFGFLDLTSQNPYGPLVEGSDGALYGTTYKGGSGKLGTVFKINKDGSGQAVLHHFLGKLSDGENPQSGLLLASNGWFYGTTPQGGFGNQGTIFALRSDGTGYTNLHQFGSIKADGLSAWAGLIQATDGALYGTTVGGGSNGAGAIFKLNLDGSGYSVLHSFQLIDKGGVAPQAGLLEASDGALYGVASSGGSNNVGVIFAMNKDGSGYSVLHHFRQGYGDGWMPESALLEGTDGALYGTTPNGGTNNLGTVFKLNKDGSGYTILHNFTGSLVGATPLGEPLLEYNGVLYGTTSVGGSNNVGTVFKLNLDGSGYSALWQFSKSGGDGVNPQAGLLAASDGALYGTTYSGGTNNAGAVFKLEPDGSLHGLVLSFYAAAGDAAGPRGGVVFGTDGLLYGTTRKGGAAGLGTVYRLAQDGQAYTLLHSFSGTNGDGSDSQGSVVLGSDGVLYGTTSGGGSNKLGTIFKINQDGTGYSVMYSFTATNGDAANPEAGLTEGNDGQLYGTTWYGGSTGNGTVFKFTKDFQTYRILHSFTGADGSGLWARVIQASDGAIYGTAYYGGAHGLGTVFKMNTDGTGFTNLHSFSALSIGPSGVVDGTYPATELLEGSDGALYGTTTSGGTNSPPGGSIFRLNKDGTGYALLSGFGASGLAEGFDGALYGTTQGGTVFMMNKDGTGFTVLRTLLATDGGAPAAQMLRQRNGVFFGTTFGGGDLGQGVVFELLPPQTPEMIAASFEFGTAQVLFAGSAGYHYSLSRSSDLSAWTTLSTNTMPSTGFYTNVDSTALPGAAFYRAAWLP